jgi:hypothetical protein
VDLYDAHANAASGDGKNCIAKEKIVRPIGSHDLLHRAVEVTDATKAYHIIQGRDKLPVMIMRKFDVTFSDTIRMCRPSNAILNVIL